jgi:hypothetical protein
MSGIVTHSYDPKYLGGEIERMMVQGQPKQKVSETPSQPSGYGGSHL